MMKTSVTFKAEVQHHGLEFKMRACEMLFLFSLCVRGSFAKFRLPRELFCLILHHDGVCNACSFSASSGLGWFRDDIHEAQRQHKGL